MNTTKLKALAARMFALANVEANETEDALNDGAAAIHSLISALESAQDERRALLATEQNLMERVKALEEGLKSAIDPLQLYRAYGWPDRAGVIQAARALLEKTV